MTTTIAPSSGATVLTSYDLGEDDENWRAFALCAQTDPDSFFPDKGGSTRQAKKVCAKCPVSDDCLEWALAKNERFGIWGGKSERERREIARNAGIEYENDEDDADPDDESVA